MFWRYEIITAPWWGGGSYPGLRCALTPPLTPESLRKPHGSIAVNPRICEALFLARYIEKYGTGTLMMIRESLAHALPEPDFIQRGGEFTSTVWRDSLTPEVLAGYKLNERQLIAVSVAKSNGRITNSGYQEATGASRPTAIRDLAELVKKGVLLRVGEARGAFYVVARKRLINDSNESTSGKRK
jgi:ATP-dependent DNA helicase RecG